MPIRCCVSYFLASFPRGRTFLVGLGRKSTVIALEFYYTHRLGSWFLIISSSFSPPQDSRSEKCLRYNIHTSASGWVGESICWEFAVDYCLYIDWVVSLDSSGSSFYCRNWPFYAAAIAASSNGSNPRTRKTLQNGIVLSSSRTEQQVTDWLTDLCLIFVSGVRFKRVTWCWPMKRDIKTSVLKREEKTVGGK